MAANNSMNSEVLRYSRQIILEDFGLEGQSRLKGARVLVAGAGGLGSPVLYYLSAAGVGNIGVADFDTVTESNLNRQVLHFTEDIGKMKTDSAEEKIKGLNPGINIIKHNLRLNANNIEEIVGGFDLVIDATDNFQARFLLSDCCYFLKKPLVEGAAVGYDGILMTIIPDKTPCYRCLYPAPPEDGVIPSCGDSGILGAVTGVVGSMMALEAIKFITGTGEVLEGRILTFNGKSSGFREIKWAKRDECPLCGKEPSIKELTEYEIKCRTKI